MMMKMTTPMLMMVTVAVVNVSIGCVFVNSIRECAKTTFTLTKTLGDA